MLAQLLLFSGGTFLYVATAHVLPEIQAALPQSPGPAAGAVKDLGHQNPKGRPAAGGVRLRALEAGIEQLHPVALAQQQPGCGHTHHPSADHQDLLGLARRVGGGWAQGG
jgi:hypothetical protein